MASSKADLSLQYTLQNVDEHQYLMNHQFPTFNSTTEEELLKHRRRLLFEFGFIWFVANRLIQL